MKKVEHLAQWFQLHPLTARYKPRLWPCQPSSVWRLFPRQSQAIVFAQKCREAVHVFALEKEKTSGGQRIYLVTSYTELWHYYRMYSQSLMHCYEVIPEGAVCKLYFDLEFHKPSNRGADGKTMVSSLVQFFCHQLMEVFGIECSEEDVLTLESSTEEKFSQHLIFNLKHAAFKDNIHVGRFVRAALRPVLITAKQTDRGFPQSVETRTHQGKAEGRDVWPESPQTKRRKQEEMDLSFLQVKDRQGQDCLFVDLGVYTRNRNFRLYKSSKAGQNAAFTVADSNQFTAAQQEGVSVEEGLFLASLICNVSFTGQRILSCSVPETKTSRDQRPQQGPATHSGSTGLKLNISYFPTLP